MTLSSIQLKLGRSAAEQEVEREVLVKVVSLEGSLALVFGETHLHELLDLALVGVLECVVLHPLLGRVLEQLAVRLVHVRHLRVLGIIYTCDSATKTNLTGLGRAHQRLQRDESRANGQGGGPLVLEDVEADGASLRRNVGVPQLGVEFHLQNLVRMPFKVE